MEHRVLCKGKLIQFHNKTVKNVMLEELFWKEYGAILSCDTW